MDRCDVELSDNSWNLSPERQAQRKDMPRTPRSVTGVEMVVNLTLILPISPLTTSRWLWVRAPLGPCFSWSFDILPSSTRLRFYHSPIK
jgi:hypothetical protein